ncbi:CRISPR-associated helicase Cas3' [Nonomuraea wenchangensis]|uniref:CRISPR-associated helicase Cas3' n=1 Tax=Nonomuraea wenchangensis TaxID=568860 RepID=UPI003322C74D
MRSDEASRRAIDLRTPWGKAGAEEITHPLICHALDTAAVAELLFPKMFNPLLRDKLRLAFAPLGAVQAWMAFLAGLHDLGKLSPAFQALRRDLATALMGEPAASMLRKMPDGRLLGERVDIPHGVLTTVHIERIISEWGAPRRTSLDVAYALGGHHGFMPRSATVIEARKKRGDHGGLLWANWCSEMVTELLRLRGLALPPASAWGSLHLDLGILVALSGLTSVSDWIASDTTNFPYAGSTVDLGEYVSRAHRQAHRAVDRLGWTAWQVPNDVTFRGLFKATPRPVQEVVEALGRKSDEQVLLIVEAPTGEGKTKAALQAAAGMVRSARDAGEELGLFFATPTKATSNQAYREIREMLKQHQPDLAVRLLHGSAAEFLAAESATADGAGAVQPTGVDEDGGSSTQADAREWFTHNKGLLAPIGVGTWDQVLMAGIRSKHVFVRMTGLAGKVVVIDEVHALDTYMSTLLDRVLRWLGFMGVSVILLSATLPAHRRSQLIGSWRDGLGQSNEQSPAATSDLIYPRVTCAAAEDITVAPVRASDLNADRRVRLSIVPDDDFVEWLLDTVKEGGCLAVVHNLVRRVEQTFTKLEEAIKHLPSKERPQLFCITGQMPDKARYEVEEQLRTAFGPPMSSEDQEDEAAQPRRPVRAIVVGTQVLESSLDLDFDALASDLAPIDSLIQRMGRVQRHGPVHQRYPHLQELTMAITGVRDTPAGPVLPPYTGSVYPRALTWRTWAVLRGVTAVRSPAQVPELIEQVYGETPVAYPPTWRDTDGADDQWARKRENAAADVQIIYLPPPDPQRSLKDITALATYAGRTRSGSGRHE